MKYFTKSELILWFGSMLAIVVSNIFIGEFAPVSLAASLIGVTALIYTAKGNPLGQGLMIVFCLIYTYVSYTFSYYGEMLTYAGMSLPMAVFSFIAWLKNPFRGNKSEVSVNEGITRGEYVFLIILTAVVTAVFYFILKFFNTANIVPSTISVTTSFLAIYLTFRRSPLYALAYAANDIVLIVLWTLAAFKDASYFSVVICFAAFFANDIYGYMNWKRISARQCSE